MSETAGVRFVRAIDLYIDGQRAEGRINSHHTEREYRYVLARHADDVDNRDPAYTNRDDVKRTLAHWGPPEHARQAPVDPAGLLRVDGRRGSSAHKPRPPDEAPPPPQAAAVPPHPRRDDRDPERAAWHAGAEADLPRDLRRSAALRAARDAGPPLLPPRLGVGVRRHRQGRQGTLGAGYHRPRADLGGDLLQRRRRRVCAASPALPRPGPQPRAA